MMEKAKEKSEAPEQKLTEGNQTETVDKGKLVCLFEKWHENTRKTRQSISICDDPKTEATETETTKLGIEGILEGFELLSFKMEGICPSECGGQMVTDVPTGQPSLENDIAGKQIDLSQMILCTEWMAEQDNNTDGVENIPQSPAQDALAMPAQRGSVGAPDGQTGQSALIEGLTNALEDACASAENPEAPVNNREAAAIKQTTVGMDRPDGTAAMASDVSPVLETVRVLDGGTRQSETDDGDTGSKRQEQAVLANEGQQQKEAAFVQASMVRTAVSQTGSVGAVQTEGLQPSLATQPTNEGDMAQNVMHIVDSITSQAQEGKSEISVTLRPEFLGKLSIKLVMDENGIKAQLKTESTMAKEAIGEQISVLHETLKEKGIQVSQLEVTYEAPAFNGHQQYDGRGQQPTAHQSGFLSGAASDSTVQQGSMETMYESDLAIKNGSVEFQA